MLRRKLSLVPILLVVGLLLTTAFAGAAPAPQAGPPDKVRVFVAFHSPPGPNEEALVRGAGGTIRYTYHLVPAIAASVPQVAIDGLRRNPRVALIEPVIAVQAVDYVTELNDTWGVKKIGGGTVHSSGNLGSAIKVAVIDSGADYGHPELAANFSTSFATSVTDSGDVKGWDFVNDDPYPLDDNGHGTHVAGTIAAVRNGSGVVGAAPEVRVYALKVLSAGGGGSYDDVVAALQWAVDHGVQVTNNSYGSSGDPGTTVKNAFDNANAAGVLNVAAAGNSGKPSGTGDNVIYPARYASVVAVAATDGSDNRASFSSTGSAVELAAPGVSIRSTVPGGGYESMSGTSMASPHAAGAAALVIASGITGPDSIRARLRATAVDLGSGGRDPYYGYGRIDAAAASAGSGGTPGNSAPIAVNDTYSVQAGTTLTVSAPGVLGNDSDVDGNPLTAVLVGGPSSGTLTFNINGGFSYTPNASFTGSDSFSYKASDGTADSNIATVDITVTSGGAMAVWTSASYATQGGKKNNLLVTVQLVDVSEKPLAIGGASVSATLKRGGSNYGSATGTTGSNGSVTFKWNSIPPGSYTTDVTAVSGNGISWTDGNENDLGFTK